MLRPRLGAVQIHFDVDDRLTSLMAVDLSFKGQPPPHPLHNVHAFAAKFPPQLPCKFIEELTKPGDVVLDPMAGSGTTIIEAVRLNRAGIAVDIDPLAVRICQSKLIPINLTLIATSAENVLHKAQHIVHKFGFTWCETVLESFDPHDREFITYWFAPKTIAELGALIRAIREVPYPYRLFLEMLFSSIIVTKSGGVSLARDLAHSRPHRVLQKQVRSALEAFREKCHKVLSLLREDPQLPGKGYVLQADCRELPIADNSVDLIITSPPYANAIDYVRAHKFSLVWLGVPLKSLTQLRRRYIGSESTIQYRGECPSIVAERTIQALRERDPRRAAIIYRYFSDMVDTLREMFRVLRPGRFAIIVVGRSTARGVVVDTPLILAEIAQRVGFRLLGVKEREIDRDRRLMPVSKESDFHGIEARMHTEHVIALAKGAHAHSRAI